MADTPADIIRFWHDIEMFNPQPIPKLTAHSDAPRSVIELGQANVPWFDADRRSAGARSVWQYRIYLGVYAVEALYRHLDGVFPSHAEAFDPRPGTESAVLGMVVDEHGHVYRRSIVLSACSWAVGRVIHHEPLSAIRGPGNISRAFADRLEIEWDGAEDRPEKSVHPVTERALRQFLTLAQAEAGIDGVPLLRSDRIRVSTRQVSASDERPPDVDFLNSFYLDELARVSAAVDSGNSSPPLSQFLRSTDRRPDRIDTELLTGATLGLLHVDRLPSGRWPTPPQIRNSLGQQIAINRSLMAERDEPLMSVNGPPGTGKTTLLTEVIAAQIVSRAQVLAGYEDVRAILTTAPRTGTRADGAFAHRVHALDDRLTGYEIVAGSSNNLAVENITEQLPAITGIDPELREAASYFTEPANAVTGSRRDDGTATPDPQSWTSWGLLTARLGNLSNCRTFADRLWPIPEGSGAERVWPRFDGNRSLREVLEDHIRGEAPPLQPWRESVARFRAAELAVERLVDARRHAIEEAQALRVASTEVARAAAANADALGQVESAERAARDGQNAARQAAALAQTAEQRLQAHLAASPRWWEFFLGLGRTHRIWSARRADYVVQRDNARERADATVHNAQRLRQRCLLARHHADQAAHALAQATTTRDTALARSREDERRFGVHHLVDPTAWWANAETRETTVPWQDDELTRARSVLTLAAMHLHEQAVLHNAPRFRDSLNAASDLILGKLTSMTATERRAAWRVLFFVVPVVSTTFASLGRLFADLSVADLDLILIDEAGQAPPQHLVGGLWRFRRAVVVGDPLQLTPVVTIPERLEDRIARQAQVPEQWRPRRTSAQALADRSSGWGTHREGSWIGIPLRVHRRCEEPMFTISNTLAYDGAMISRVDRCTEPRIVQLPPSAWIDVTGSAPGEHLVPEELAALQRLIESLSSTGGIDPGRIIVVSPFTAVATELERLARAGVIGTGGTIHTAQGREADVTILVLGTGARRPGARNWATETPNLMNVAVSRAKRRLYVIGDASLWGPLPMISTLLAHLPVTTTEECVAAITTGAEQLVDTAPRGLPKVSVGSETDEHATR